MSSTIKNVTRMLRQLVAAPTVSSVSPEFDMPNQIVIELMAEWLDAMGFLTSVIAIPDAPGKTNLIAQLGDGENGLVLAGHTDTVPCDKHAWSTDPFELVEKDGKLFGLGTTDMKGFLAIAIEAARSFINTPLKHPLIILATADEESTMKGALHLSAIGKPRARYAVIGEPSNMIPVRTHKGVVMESIALIGRSGHSSNPALGVNALDGMYHAIGEIMQWRDELMQQHHNDAFEIPYPTVNLGYIRGGDNPNRICGHCELHFDMRLMPGMSMSTLRPQLRSRIESKINSELRIEMKNLDVEIPAFETSADARLVRSLETLTGQSAQSVAFATEAPFFHKMGMETVVWGPGEIELAHQPDEYLRVDRIEPTKIVLEELIRQICVK